MATKDKYQDEELSALIQETRSQIADLLKSEEAALRKNAIVKADDDKGPPDEGSESSGGDSSGGDSAPAPSAEPSASAPPGGDASAPPPAPGGDPMASAAPPGGAPADPAAAAGSAGGDSVETLMAAYSQLPPESLRSHFMALKQVIATQMAAPAAGGAPGGAPPMGADPMASAAPPMGADPMSAGAGAPPPAAPPAGPGMAGEGSKPIDPASQMALKSEKEMSKRFEQIEKSLESVTKGFELLMRKPDRKGITGKDVIAKSEPQAVDITKLKPAEINKALSDVARNPNLKKSDRDLINGYFNKKVKVADLAPLFEKK